MTNALLMEAKQWGGIFFNSKWSVTQPYTILQESLKFQYIFDNNCNTNLLTELNLNKI